MDSEMIRSNNMDHQHPPASSLAVKIRIKQKGTRMLNSPKTHGADEIYGRTNVDRFVLHQPKVYSDVVESCACANFTLEQV